MRKTAYTDTFRDYVLSRVARGNETIVEASVSMHVPYATLEEWCREAGVHERTERTLHVWVPTNRYDADQLPTHMDGWNEILDAYKANRHRGGERELSNVAHVACYARAAMREQGWDPMGDKTRSVPCSVSILFVERNRRRDIPNVYGGSKYAIDALTSRHKAGACAIYDDSPRWLQRVAYGHDVDAKAPGMHVCVRALYPRSCDLRKG